MKKQSPKSKKLLFVFAISAVLLLGFAALIVHNYKTKTSFKFASQKAEELKPEQNSQDAVNAAINADAAAEQDPIIRTDSELAKILPTDLVVGEASAPVTIIEYASLSCPHCAAFYREAYDKLKDEYIATGKVKFAFRHFPLNQSALSAAMFVECQAKDNNFDKERYYSVLKSLFKTQDSWAFDPKFDERLETIAKLDGMDTERFKSCLADKKLQEKILSSRIEVSKSLQLRSVPSFIINGELSEGYVDYLTIKKLVDRKLAEKK
jgi:protein-disulfide isomerase